MTGTQPNPATGVTLKGKTFKKLILEDVCKACGADTVDVVTPSRTRSAGLVLQRLRRGTLGHHLPRALQAD
jgi:TPP-dependent indolepyruvate ferredoxin oxidoreductase alpha subunit